MEKTELILKAIFKNNGEVVGVRFTDKVGDLLDMTNSQFLFCISPDKTFNDLDEEKIIKILSERKVNFLLECDNRDMSLYVGKYTGGTYDIIEVDTDFFDESIKPEEYLSLIYPNAIVHMKSPEFIDVSKYVDTFNSFIYGTNIISDFNIKNIIGNWFLSGIRVTLFADYKREMIDEVTMQLGNWLSQYGLSFSKKITCECDEIKERIEIVIYIDNSFIKSVKNLPEYVKPEILGKGIVEDDYVSYKAVKTSFGNIFEGIYSDKNFQSYSYIPAQGIDKTDIDVGFDFNNCFTQYMVAPYPNSVYIYFYKNLTYESDNVKLEHSVLEGLTKKNDILKEIVLNVYPVNGIEKKPDGYVSYCYVECDTYGVSLDEIAESIKAELQDDNWGASMLNSRLLTLKCYDVRVRGENLLSIGVYMRSSSDSLLKMNGIKFKISWDDIDSSIDDYDNDYGIW